MRPIAYIEGCDLYCPSCARLDEPVWREAVDAPAHCANCEELLDFDLTEEGCDYVLDAILLHGANGQGRPEILGEWLDRYKNEVACTLTRRRDPYDTELLLDAVHDLLRRAAAQEVA